MIPPPRDEPMSDPDPSAALMLMRQAQAGDEHAFTGLVHAFAGRLFRFLTATGLSATDADDLVQETFIRVHRHLDRYDARWSVSTWFFTIANRLALNHRRDRRVLRPLEEVGTLAGAEVDQAVDDGLWEVARAVLSLRDFQVLWLRYGEDRSVEELAAVLGVQPGNAKVILHRARNRLQEHLPSICRPLAVSATVASDLPLPATE